MGWVSGQPVCTPADEQEWRSWRAARKLEQQRSRRARMRRIDYYPSRDALAVIEGMWGRSMGQDFSSIIDRLVLAVSDIPE